MRTSRRSLLGLTGVALGGGLAGCASSSDGSTTPPPASATASDGRATLELAADVVRQSSPAVPGRVAATLTNTGTGTVQLGYGPTLLFSDTGPDEEVARPDPLVLDPESRGVLRSDSVQSSDGCWRYPADGIGGVQSSLEFRVLAPGDDRREVYDVYTGAEADSCLPAGSYRHQDIVETPDQKRSATLTLRIDIDGSGRLTATGTASALE